MGDVRLGPERVAKTWVWAGFSPCQPEGWHFGDLGHPKLPVLRFVGGERGRGGSAPARTPRDGGGTEARVRRKRCSFRLRAYW